MATASFAYTGADQSWQVPAGIAGITVKLVGAPGACPTSAPQTAGKPGMVDVYFPVNTGDIIGIGVGGNTLLPGTFFTYGDGAGCADNGNGYPGGGRSWVSVNGKVVVVAGGGGGAGAGAGAGGGADLSGAGGAGGGTIGAAGYSLNSGRGGTQVGPGSGGVAPVSQLRETSTGTVISWRGSNGSPGAGSKGGLGGWTSAANGGNYDPTKGGGGGAGGLFGAGGGAELGSEAASAPGGGGGSNFIDSVINNGTPLVSSNVQGYDATEASVEITYVNTPPVVTPVSPSGGQYVPNSYDSVNFAWKVYDPGDTIASFQFKVINPTDGSTVYDSGLDTTPPSVDYYGLVHWFVQILGQPDGRLLYWQVTVTDSGGNTVTSPPSYFTVGTGPDFSITPADSSAVTSAAPTIDWSSYTVQMGAVLAAWSVVITDQDTGAIVARAGAADQSTSWTPPNAVLLAGKTYIIEVTLTDSFQMSTTKHVAVTVDYTAPAVIKSNVHVTDLDTDGYVLIQWDATHIDDYFYSWRVYRIADGETDWTLLGEEPNPAVTEYHDWLAKSNTGYRYCVTQVAVVTTTYIESQVGYTRDDSDAVIEVTESVEVVFHNYWLINSVDHTINVKMLNVTDAPLTLAYDSTSYNVINRGRRFEYGTRLGYSGTITAQVRGYDGSPAVMRAKLEALRETIAQYYLRTPFGELFLAAIGDIDFTPIAGTDPTTPMFDVSLPVTEVSP